MFPNYKFGMLIDTRTNDPKNYWNLLSFFCGAEDLFQSSKCLSQNYLPQNFHNSQNSSK